MGEQERMILQGCAESDPIGIPEALVAESAGFYSESLLTTGTISTAPTSNPLRSNTTDPHTGDLSR